MEMKMNIVYEVKEGDKWRDKESIDIKSNIADDKLIDCKIAKSLVEHLNKESALLEPDKLLLKIAEAQKREIELNLEALDDMALTTKTRAEKVHQNILEASLDSEQKYEELQNKFNETTQKFRQEIADTTDSLKDDMAKLETVSKRILEIDSYGLERLEETLRKLVALVEQDPEIVKLVLNYKS